MKDFFGKMGDSFRRTMVGRYGMDDLSKALVGVSMVFLILSLFFRGGLFFILAVVTLVFNYYRMFSRNFAARSAENAKYLELTGGIRKKVRIGRKRIEGRKEYRFFKCPGCGQEVRVPKGKGHIMITCPKCAAQFDKTV
jgi:uncharacterized C2H2 Zn-finger protein